MGDSFDRILDQCNGVATLSIMILRIKTLSIMTLSIIILSIMTISIMTQAS
jgi:hypothetical protein